MAALFALNIALTGEWNYQGGERKTFYSAGDGDVRRRLPVSDRRQHVRHGRPRPRRRRFVRSAVHAATRCSTCFRHNLGYFLFGRHTGFAVYFFPGLMAILLFLAATRDRAMWQWLTLAAGVGHRGRAAALHAVHLVRRRRPGRQSLFPRHLRRVPVPRAAAADRGGRTRDDGDQRAVRGADRLEPVLRVAQSRRAQPRPGCIRWLPTELTLVNDLPVNVEPVAHPAAARRHAAGARRISSTTTSTTARATRSGCAASRAPTSCCARRSQPEATRRGAQVRRSLRDRKLEVHPRDRAEAESRDDRDRRRETRVDRHGAELAADVRARDAARPAVQVPIRGSRPTTSTSCRSRRRPASCRCSRTARATAGSSA